METTIFLASILGLVYLSLGLGMLLNGDYYRKAMRKMYENTAFIYLAGFLAVAVGFSMVNAHNEWNTASEGLISLIGWVALFKGVMLLAFPKFIRYFEVMLKPKLFGNLVTPLVLILGIVFAYIGFGG